MYHLHAISLLTLLCSLQDSRIRQVSSAGVKNATPISLDVTNDQALDAEVSKHNLVISLIL